MGSFYHDKEEPKAESVPLNTLLESIPDLSFESSAAKNTGNNNGSTGGDCQFDFACQFLDDAELNAFLDN
jgi:hypothetical protein